MVYLNWKVLSLEKSRFNVLKLQLRIVKCILVGDISKSLSIQKILLSSHSARVISIQSTFSSTLFPNKESFSFSDKIQLNFLLLSNLNSWSPSYSFYNNFVFSFSDICWQNLIMLALVPAHEANFSPLNFGFRSISSLDFIQRIMLIKLSDFFISSNMKIISVKFSFPKKLNKLLIRFILSKLFISRSIKISFFKYLSLGFDFNSYDKLYYLNNLQTFFVNLFFDNFNFLQKYSYFFQIIKNT